MPIGLDSIGDCRALAFFVASGGTAQQFLGPLQRSGQLLRIADDEMGHGASTGT
ncbi:hypothetical protein IED13_23265 [Bosea sp. SSUT16]|uniref:Uncharacterized protein n=1 Tax=Bosea spartocytisi TaxID=2773451 RepID=A0A927EFI7_9HYPH|nr:hypothetical protein [Bosea spartocytisi]MBD3848626.1 hypothetical protein [Bosea spartocytisi]MCT4475074.1 hypothetical protein [Bosea spartocytisi]